MEAHEVPIQGKSGLPCFRFPPAVGAGDWYLELLKPSPDAKRILPPLPP